MFEISEENFLKYFKIYFTTTPPHHTLSIFVEYFGLTYTGMSGLAKVTLALIGSLFSFLFINVKMTKLQGLKAVKPCFSLSKHKIFIFILS